jgi:hypothetical protein
MFVGTAEAAGMLGEIIGVDHSARAQVTSGGREA